MAARSQIQTCAVEMDRVDEILFVAKAWSEWAGVMKVPHLPLDISDAGADDQL